MMNSVPIAVYIGLFTETRIGNIDIGQRYLVLLVGSTLTSIGQFLIDYWMNNNNINSNKVNKKRIISTIII